MCLLPGVPSINLDDSPYPVSHPRPLQSPRPVLLFGTMSYVMVDIESDGPIPGDYSMICFGAVIVEPGLSRTFYGQLRPISERFIPDALAVSGFSREQTLAFPEPRAVMD